jgi:hypothetical protein
MFASPHAQERRAQRQADDPSKQWPEVHYLVGDEESLPLAPGSVDGGSG